MPKVLIADDQESMRSLIRVTLDSGHFEILEAPDGAVAARIAQDERPDLVFLDWTMPVLSGIEVCRKLRDDPRTADTKIVMVSGRADVTERAAGFAAGADDYITKPFSPLELLDKVSEVLGPEAFI
jgi:two-component system, OmpR family, phosphate regulon response regulator PhoB